MILTPHCVFIHQAKTGGSFVTTVLRQLYGDQALDVHKPGTCDAIPDSHRHLPVFSARRVPYDQYVSLFYFGWWRIHPEVYCGEEAMRAQFPTFPNLTFNDYVHLANDLFVGCFQSASNGFNNVHYQGPDRLGWLTETFVRFFCRDARGVFAALSGPDPSAQVVSALYPVHFLRTNRLNEDLHSFLVTLGHDPASIAWVLSREPVRPQDYFSATPEPNTLAEIGAVARDAGLPPRPPGSWRDHYSPELLAFVRHRERLLFELFPDWKEEA